MRLRIAAGVTVLLSLTFHQAAAGPLIFPRTSLQVPILMYHYIDHIDPAHPPRWHRLFIPPDVFDAQLTWLRDNGYTSIDFDDYERIRRGEQLPPLRPVILTFDDGYADASTQVLPRLTALDMKGVFYVVTGFLGKPGYLTAFQVQGLAAAGMQIGGHTVTHPDLRRLTRGRRRKELKDSRETLEALAGRPVVHLAYPAGRYTAQVIHEVTTLGYHTAVTTRDGIASFSGSPFALPRVRMMTDTSLATVLSAGSPR
ncbi:MAG: polysaccharide deacetylase family protein [Candidatus Peregrinibacteria bacterium Greene0416_19]|nr:MAG: polysaccharide deacetylase family protein [Candidatus Peregrinibacteria bacterium Greene0416_19]